MVEFTTGDILRADAEALVNPVNCVGVMGRGLALTFKAAFPDSYDAYVQACSRGDVVAGRLFVFERAPPARPRYIINFPTKRHWRDRSRLKDVEAGLVALRAAIEQRGIRSVAVPALGAGLGGLPWNAVRPRIEAALGPLPNTRVTIYEPHGTPEPAASDEANIDMDKVEE